MSEEKLGFGENLEREILSLCIHDVQFFLDVHDYLKPAHFVSDTMGKAYAVVQAYFDIHHTIPNESIVAYQIKRMGIDEEVSFKKEVLNKVFLLDETIKLVRHQEMKKFIFGAITEVEKKAPNLDKLEDELRKVLNIQPTHDLGLFYFDVDERFARLRSTKTERIPTGIPSVDKALGGGLAAKELVCFGAPSGAGKSYCLAIAGAHILKTRHNVVHYTFEMSEELTSLRYDCALLNATSDDIFSDVDKAKESILKYKRIMEENLVIKEFPTKMASINTIRSHIHKLKEQRNFVPDVVIIDYGDIMKPSRHFTSRYEEQGSIFQEMRALGQEMNIPVMSATQTNRGAVSKDIIGMEDLGDSYDKARIMDALFMLIQKPEEKEDGLIRIYDAKVRNGRSGKMAGYEIDYARASLKLIEEVDTKT